jgi:Tol biopolymer transport system component
MRPALAFAALVLLAGCATGDDSRPAPTGENLIAFSSKRDGDFDLYVMGPNGTDVRQLTRNDASGANEADDDGPVWSPDGTRLAFLSTRDHTGDSDEDRELYVVDADGDSERRLTENRLAEYSPDWSPDGSRIVFLRRLPAGTAIFEIEADGGGERRLTEPRAALDVSLDWSPDGKLLVVTRFDPAASRPSTEIYTVDPGDGGATRLTDAPGVDGDAAWSPDGSRLVFVSDRDRNGRCLFHDCAGFATEVYVMNADGGAQRRVTRTTALEAFPAWSPDGSRLVFARIADDNDDYELFAINADGTCERQLTDNDAWDWTPSWTGSGGAPLQC